MQRIFKYTLFVINSHKQLDFKMNLVITIVLLFAVSVSAQKYALHCDVSELSKHVLDGEGYLEVKTTKSSEPTIVKFRNQYKEYHKKLHPYMRLFGELDLDSSIEEAHEIAFTWKATDEEDQNGFLRLGHMYVTPKDEYGRPDFKNVKKFIPKTLVIKNNLPTVQNKKITSGDKISLKKTELDEKEKHIINEVKNYLN